VHNILVYCYYQISKSGSGCRESNSVAVGLPSVVSWVCFNSDHLEAGAMLLFYHGRISSQRHKKREHTQESGSKKKTEKPTDGRPPARWCWCQMRKRLFVPKPTAGTQRGGGSRERGGGKLRAEWPGGPGSGGGRSVGGGWCGQLNRCKQLHNGKGER
jgi:hypothetical protein